MDMRDVTFGTMDSHQLTLRWVTPWEFRSWGDGRNRFAWRKLVNPANWWRAIFRRQNWAAWCTWRREMNHRCYCPVGCVFDGNIAVAGFSLFWWFGRYTGDVPCPCDEAMAEQFPEAP